MEEEDYREPGLPIIYEQDIFGNWNQSKGIKVKEHEERLTRERQCEARLLAYRYFCEKQNILGKHGSQEPINEDGRLRTF